VEGLVILKQLIALISAGPQCETIRLTLSLALHNSTKPHACQRSALITNSHILPEASSLLLPLRGTLLHRLESRDIIPYLFLANSHQHSMRR
jgi:hypothetical protein